jgi:hypothetical protein
LSKAGLVDQTETGELVASLGVFRELLATPPANRGQSADGGSPTSGPEKFLVDGRVERLPRKQADRDGVVALLAEQIIAPAERMTERELMTRLASRADGPVGLRRAMVDAGLLARTPNGAEYWLQQ